jgi:DNA-binding LytR/AlgR family response regulator
MILYCRVSRYWLPIFTKDIVCFYRENLNYLLTFSREKYILDFVTLDEIEELPDPKVYYRAKRQSIIHIDSIQSIKPQENQKLIITLKTPLKWKRTSAGKKRRGLRSGLTVEEC